MTNDITMTLLFVVQMGEHSSDGLAVRLLSMTMAMLTLFMFMYYNCDITAEMTSGPPDIPVKNFEDVLHHGYKVTTYSPYYQSQLAGEKPGSPKLAVYEKYLKGREVVNSIASVKDAMTEVLEEPKTLMYGHHGVIGPFSNIDRGLRSQFQTLKIDDGSWMLTTLALQKDSEFLQVFNYYIMKQYEHGLLTRNYKKGWSDSLRNEQFWIKEAYPLELSNVMFPFVALVVGIFAALAIATMESSALKLKRRAEYVTMSSASSSCQSSPGYLSNKSFII